MFGEPLWIWLVFAGVLFTGLAVDLFLHRGERGDSHRGSVVWAVVWVTIGLGFAGFVYATMGAEKASNYVAAYLIEESLSVDNLFVFLVIFQSLKIPQSSQRTVLSWGIFGALIFRMIFIFLGTEAIERWEWVAWIFGAILLYAAVKVFFEAPEKEEENKAVRWLSKHLPLTPQVHGNRFFVVQDGRRLATPLLLAVLGLELTDIMFAVDSVPAAFSVSREKFIIYSSNAFAILGLRSLFMVLSRAIADLEYLHFGLSAVLAFAGLKLIGDRWVHIPSWLSIAIIVVCIGAAVVASLLHRNAPEETPSERLPGSTQGAQRDESSSKRHVTH
ncbi:MAG: TerC/Alx family metal homeostasis membrane protein [Myxococcaceae bacterium]|nr:TerC/Alx family metal homeostasis membrane protein [Myxococcaceae bacterium]